MRLPQGGLVERDRVLGFTFKENVPDTRNTRVIDIVNSLAEFDLNIQVHDPEADSDEAFRHYDINIVADTGQLKPGSAVVLAVSHDEYRKGGWDLIAPLLEGGRGIVFDVNRILDRDAIPDGIHLIRL